MSATVLFSPMAYSRYEASQTLPAKFSRMLKKTGLADKVKGKTVAIKMHVGDGITYSTIPPVFVRKLVTSCTRKRRRLLHHGPLCVSAPSGAPRLHGK